MLKDGAMIYIIFILFGLLFFQNLLNIFQYKRIVKQYKEISKNSYYASVGTRRRWGRKRTAIVGFTKEGIINQTWILNGILVTSMFHQIHDFDGLTCEELFNALDKKNKDHDAIKEAATYMKMRLENTATSDEDYFKNNPRGLLSKEDVLENKNEVEKSTDEINK